VTSDTGVRIAPRKNVPLVMIFLQVMGQVRGVIALVGAFVILPKDSALVLLDTMEIDVSTKQSLAN